MEMYLQTRRGRPREWDPLRGGINSVSKAVRCEVIGLGGLPGLQARGCVERDSPVACVRVGNIVFPNRLSLEYF